MLAELKEEEGKQEEEKVGGRTESSTEDKTE